MVSDLVGRQLALQIGYLHAEGSGQKLSGAYERRVAGFDPRHGSSAHTDALGESLLG